MVVVVSEAVAEVGVAAEAGVASESTAAITPTAVAISATAGADTSAPIIDRSPVGVIATHDRTEKQKSGAPVSPTHLIFVWSAISCQASADPVITAASMQ